MFIDSTAAFSWPGTADLGVYHSYSTSAGDKSNLLFDADEDSKWDRALAKLGVHPAMLSPTGGRA